MTTQAPKNNNLEQMRTLEIGQSVDFPLAKVFSIRTSAANLNLMRGFKSLATSTDRKQGTGTGTRIA